MTPTKTALLALFLAGTEARRMLRGLTGAEPPCVDGTVIEGTSGDDYLVGTPCNDIIIGHGGNDIIIGKGGDDLIVGGDGHDSLVGGEGHDTIKAGSGFDTVQGNSGNDLILGSEGDDELLGGGGADTIHGEDGSDLIVGGDGSDHLVGGRGFDTVRGNSGNDVVQGNDGNDDLSGGAGGDTITGGDGSAMTRSGTIGQSVVQTLDQAMDDVHEKQNQADATAPMLVHTGRAQMECKDITETADKIEKIVGDDHQGYVENLSTSKDSSSFRPKRNRIDMTMRVASSDFLAVIQSIRQMEQDDNERVKLLSLSTESRDVTDDYVDASSRADVIDATRKSMKELLSKADSVKDVLKIQQELMRLNQQYESLTQRAKLLKKQSDWSTLYIGLVEELPPKPEPTPEPPHEHLVAFLPKKSAHRAWLIISNGFAEAGNTVVFFTVLILPLVLIAGLVVYALAGLVMNAMKGNKKNKKPAKEAEGDSLL